MSDDAQGMPTTVEVPADHPAFPGHFPGQPLWPGVLVLAEVMEAIAADAAMSARVGPSPRLTVAKFLSPVLPGAQLRIHFTPTDSGLAFEARVGDRRCASGQFADLPAPGP